MSVDHFTTMFLLFSLALREYEPRAPAPWYPTPSPSQVQYHDEEISVFFHYGMNTYTGKEWGDGNEDPNSFNPTALDTDQWVKTVKEAGVKRVIIVGRHHDGFCIWKTKFTDHQVNESKAFQETSKKLGQSGDVLEELSKACTKYDVDMGFYLSPWDVNSPYYGKEVEYNEYYMNQLQEILGDKKYGNNGKFVEVWMDGAKGSGAKAQVYWFTKWFDLIERLQPGCVVFSPYATAVRWIGNENGIAGEPCWSKSNKTKLIRNYDFHEPLPPNYNNNGDPVGDIWTIGECDVSITSGWFWHEGKTPKSMKELATIYFSSVGRGQPLLLNIPPNKVGVIPDEFVKRMQELHQTINESFSHNLAAGPQATVTAVSGNNHESKLYSPKNMLSEDHSFWAPDDGSIEAKIMIDLGKPTVFDVISIREEISLGQRINEFEVFVLVEDTWKSIFKAETIGARRLIRFRSMTAQKIEIRITKSQANPIIRSIGVYKAVREFAVDDGFPSGLSYIDHKKLDKKGKWTEESDGTSMWSNEAGASLETKFTGTKAFIAGTKDPNHGIMNVYLDGKLVASPDTHDSKRTTNTLIYSGDDMPNAEHTLKVEVKTKAIGIHGYYVLQNEGRGMFEIESLAYSVLRGKNVTLKVKRVAGSTGEVSVVFQTQPGTAVHGKHYIDVTQKLVFAEGTTEQLISVQTIDNKEMEDDLTFFGQIVDASNKAIIGFNASSTVTILRSNEKSILDQPQKSNGVSFSIIMIITGCIAFIACVIIIIAIVKIKGKKENESFNAEPLLSSNLNE